MSRFGSPSRDDSLIKSSLAGNPNKSSFFNYKKDFHTWDRLTRLDEFYSKSHKFSPKQDTGSEDEISSLVNVSESETKSEKSKRIKMRKRNERLQTENLDDSVKVESIKQPLLSQQTLVTLWKLYRNVGESVEDVKHRLVDLNDNKRNVSTSEHNVKFECDYAQVKKELSDRSDDDFDSENDVSIKEEAEEVEEFSEDFCSGKLERERIELENWDSGYENSLDLSELLVVELQESKRIIQLSGEECSSSSSRRPIAALASWITEPVSPTPANCTYDVPRLRQITNAELVITNKLQPRRATKRSSSSSSVIVREALGVRTVNYDKPTAVSTIPDCFKVSRLSDSSGEELDRSNRSGRKRNRLNVEADRWVKFELSSESDANQEVEPKRRKIAGPAERVDEPTLRTSDCCDDSSSSSCSCSRSSCSCSASSTTSSDDERND